jgi:hypothetical protein
MVVVVESIANAAFDVHRSAVFAPIKKAAVRHGGAAI